MQTGVRLGRSDHTAQTTERDEFDTPTDASGCIPAFRGGIMPRMVPIPTLSVVICTVNRPALLRRSIAAIAAQDLDGTIETIVVFDGTPPDASLVVEGGRRPVRVMANDHAPGLPGGRNAGAAVASAPLLAFCDDDDCWLPTKARRQVDHLAQHPDADVVVCGLEIATGDRVVRRALAGPTVTFDDLLASRVMEANFVTAMVRTDAYRERIGGADEAIPGGYGEDYEWALRAARRGPLDVIGEPLVRIEWAGGSYFAARWATIAHAIEYLLELVPEFAGHPRGAARLQGQRAFALAASGDRPAAWNAIATTLRLAPGERRGWLAALVALRLLRADFVVRRLNRRGRGI